MRLSPMQVFNTLIPFEWWNPIKDEADKQGIKAHTLVRRAVEKHAEPLSVVDAAAMARLNRSDYVRSVIPIVLPELNLEPVDFTTKPAKVHKAFVRKHAHGGNVMERVMVPKEVHAALQMEAFRHNLSVAEFMRALMTKYINKEKRDAQAS
jgi:hypothetical protein